MTTKDQTEHENAVMQKRGRGGAAPSGADASGGPGPAIHPGSDTDLTVGDAMHSSSGNTGGGAAATGTTSTASGRTTSTVGKDAAPARRNEPPPLKP